MSRRSTKTIATNNLKTRSGRRVNERSSGVFESAKIQSVSETVLLYKLVFMTRKAALLSVLMCLCFLSQPFQNVYANELENPSETTPVKISLPSEVVQTSVGDTTATDLIASVDKTINVENSIEEAIDQSTNKSDEPEVVSKSEPTLEPAETTTVALTDGSEIEISPLETVFDNENNLIDTTTDSDGVFESDSSNSDIPDEQSVSLSDTEIVEELSGTTDDEVVTDSAYEDDLSTEDDSDISADVISTTDDIDLPVADNNLISIVESDSVFEFSKSECTRIEDGSFYCQKNDGNAVMDDSLIASPDADGDLEIYLIRDGVRTQITYNLVDDASPYYDEYSKTIVWHRLVNDRYQIISYDTKTGKEEQLTSTSVNNMQPTRHGEYTVWQRWVDNNWEVILYDGIRERQITDSPRHDIAPHVRGPLVIWNSRSNDGTQSLMTYDINDRTYTTIADGDGVSVSNPRMVVMYEAMYENGDIIMKGFDLVSGEIIPLQSLPKQLPDELPGTDSTGETRALIQSKPTTKQTEVSNNLGSGGSSTPPILPDPVDDGTLDLRPATTTEMIIDNLPEATTTASIPDLILPVILSTSTPENSATSSQTISE